MKTYLTSLAAAFTAAIPIFILLSCILKKQSKMESNSNERFNEFKGELTGAKTALENVATEMAGMKDKIATLQSAVADMGLTRAQEDELLGHIRPIRTQAESLSTVVEGASQPTEETPTEPGTEEPTPGEGEEEAA